MHIVSGLFARRIIGTAFPWIRRGIFLGSLVAFGWIASGAFQSTGNLSNVRWVPFIGAFALQLILTLLLMLFWERLLSIFWYGASEGRDKYLRTDLYTAFSRSWLARYLPGRLWALGGRVLLASKAGVSAEAVARSGAFEILFSYGTITILGLALTLATKVNIWAGAGTLLAGGVAFAISVPLAQRILSSGNLRASHNSRWNRIRFRAQRFLVGVNSLSLTDTVWWTGLYCLHTSFQLLFIVLIAESFVDLTLSQAVTIAGVWGLSLTLGWLSFLTPAGLGVREGLALVFFTQVLDAPTVILVIAASRIVMTVSDLAFVGAVELLAMGVNFKRTQPQSSA